ncbi:AMP-binding protein [Nocardia terpenica]|uniref:class I adenylate-forming enzyme family protein n=1 Tax=Nocardia terpenica TaxID=455432 RepID=UPI001893384C|nr:AMP-binding protein [Nocardia terpenica]MBF6062811.1 AMP-binding protein [Nocardia terpenica]MBF6105054.1 AMP-binding protein [Nocardia terpenica]MBF6112509.1 AMP-binding protein [Nocardia terpenica]MBF6118782.1 AMP-binding protein [Nocardia terpenica]MBF6154251.1 AMP-binding protein [Nocardia terpenica]
MTADSADKTTAVGFTLAAFAQHPEQVAITHARGEWTYGELLDRIYRTARALSTQGLGRGDAVALATGAAPETFVLRFAANTLGCATVVLYDDLAPSVLVDMLRYVDAKAVVLRPDHGADRVVTAAKQIPGIAVLAMGTHPEAVNLADLADAESGEPVPVDARPEDLSSIRLTGGSTGDPKGIPQTAGLPAYFAPQFLPMWATTQLMCTAIGHLGGQLAEVVLTAGGRVVLQDGVFNPDQVLKAIEREKVQFIWMQPAMLHRLLDHPALDSTDTSSLRSLMITGGPSTPERIVQALERFGPIITQGYGAYEIGQITMLSPQEHQRPELLTTVGRPFPGVQVSIRNSEGEDQQTGNTGEIWVRGGGLMTGYYKRPDLTAQALRDGWYNTGDLGFLDAEGYLSVVGRSKDIIIGHPETVYPAQVEKVLHRHANIQQAVVFGITNGIDNDEKICAAIVPTPPEHKLSADDVTGWVRSELGDAYAPEVVLLLAEIPTTGSNKPDRTALRRTAANHMSV